MILGRNILQFLLTAVTLWNFCNCQKAALQRRCSRPRLRYGRAKIKMGFRKVYFSCKRNFVLIGKTSAVCINGVWNEPTPFCVTSGCKIPKVDKYTNMISLYNDKVLQFSCAPNHMLQGSRKIYCWKRGRWNKRAPRCIKAPFSCTFESSYLCGWSSDDEMDFKWTWHKGSTPTKLTGPTRDHTFGKVNSKEGHYLFIEASLPRKPGHKARLLSPFYLTNGSEHCFTFWYHMAGKYGVGTLNIYVRSKDLTRPLMQPFSRKGNQGMTWHRGAFTIPYSDVPYQIYIEAIRGRSYFSDIAIDDVNIGPCLSTTSAETTTGHIATSQVTANTSKKPSNIPHTMFASTVVSTEKKVVSVSGFRRNVTGSLYTDAVSTEMIQSTTKGPMAAGELIVNCTFESGNLCGWANDAEDDFDWAIHTGSTQTRGTGPSRDHTFASIHNKDGHYLYIEGSPPQLAGHTALLKSPFYPAVVNKIYCLTFWYHMYGKIGVGSLHVYVRREDSNKPLESLFYQTGNRGDIWHKAQLQIPVIGRRYQIYIEAIRGRFYYSDIAIDDISIQSCGTITEGTPVTTETTTAATTVATTKMNNLHMTSTLMPDSTYTKRKQIISTSGHAKTTDGDHTLVVSVKPHTVTPGRIYTSSSKQMSTSAEAKTLVPIRTDLTQYRSTTKAMLEPHTSTEATTSDVPASSSTTEMKSKTDNATTPSGMTSNMQTNFTTRGPTHTKTTINDQITKGQETQSMAQTAPMYTKNYMTADDTTKRGPTAYQTTQIDVSTSKKPSQSGFIYLSTDRTIPATTKTAKEETTSIAAFINTSTTKSISRLTLSTFSSKGKGKDLMHTLQKFTQYISTVGGIRTSTMYIPDETKATSSGLYSDRLTQSKKQTSRYSYATSLSPLVTEQKKKATTPLRKITATKSITTSMNTHHRFQTRTFIASTAASQRTTSKGDHTSMLSHNENTDVPVDNSTKATSVTEISGKSLSFGKIVLIAIGVIFGVIIFVCGMLFISYHLVQIYRIRTHEKRLHEYDELLPIALDPGMTVVPAGSMNKLL